MAVSILTKPDKLYFLSIYNEKGHFYYRPQRSCGQGNVVTRVCHSVHRGVSASVHAGIPPPEADTPGSRHPLEADPPKADIPPKADKPPTPKSRHPPEADPPTPRKQTRAYGQRAAGTHPTGMHSWYFYHFSYLNFE